jgi:hypothetical protein
LACPEGVKITLRLKQVHMMQQTQEDIQARTQAAQIAEKTMRVRSGRRASFDGNDRPPKRPHIEDVRQLLLQDSYQLKSNC